MDKTWLSQRYAGKSLLRNEIRLKTPLFEYLLTENYFASKPSIRKFLFHMQCQRCGNQRLSLFGKLPALEGSETYVYCRDCINLGRVIENQSLYEWTGPEYSWPKHCHPCTWEGELTNAQQKAADRMVQAIKKQEKELLTWAVCGAGKTEILFSGITEVLKQGKRLCIATPRKDVVLELLPRLREAFADVHIQGLYGNSPDKDGTAQLLVATTHQLLRFNQAFDVLIIDEVDAFPYTHDPALPFAAEKSKKIKSTTIYLTATPAKTDQHRMKTGKLPHVFIPKRFHDHPLPVPSFKMSYSLKKDIQQKRLPKSFSEWMKRRKRSIRQLLIFVPAIDMTEIVVKCLSESDAVNGRIKAVHASDQNREEKVEQFRNGELDIIVTTTILERGVTFPSVDVLILDAGHAVFNEQALVQIAGRAGRSPYDPEGEVVFFHDGRTNAMVEAVNVINYMNKRGGFH